MSTAYEYWRIAAYDISNNQITGSAFMGAVGLDWQFGGFAADQAAQLVQAMAGFGGGGGAALSTTPIRAETSQQQPMLTTSQHA